MQILFKNDHEKEYVNNGTGVVLVSILIDTDNSINYYGNGRKWQPIPVFLPEESHRQRSLVSYSAWGLKELDTIEELNNKNNSTVFSSSTSSIFSYYVFYVVLIMFKFPLNLCLYVF